MQALTRYAIVLWLAGLTCFVAMAFLAPGSDRFPGDEWLATRFQDADTPLVAEPIEGAEQLVELPFWPEIVLAASVAAVRLLGVRAVPLIVVALASRFLVTIIKERICQNSGLEHYRGSLKGEKPTHFVSEGWHREARIRALAAPEP